MARPFDGKPSLFRAQPDADLARAVPGDQPIDQMVAADGGGAPALIGKEEFPLDLDSHPGAPSLAADLYPNKAEDLFSADT
jgi:hypothetical protein